MDKGLEETAELWPDVREGFGFIRRAAHELGNERGLSGKGVKRRYQAVLDGCSADGGRAGRAGRRPAGRPGALPEGERELLRRGCSTATTCRGCRGPTTTWSSSSAPPATTSAAAPAARPPAPDWSSAARCASWRDWAPAAGPTAARNWPPTTRRHWREVRARLGETPPVPRAPLPLPTRPRQVPPATGGQAAQAGFTVLEKKSVHLSQRHTPRVRGMRRAFARELRKVPRRHRVYSDETGPRSR